MDQSTIEEDKENNRWIRWFSLGALILLAATLCLISRTKPTDEISQQKLDSDACPVSGEIYPKVSISDATLTEDQVIQILTPFIKNGTLNNLNFSNNTVNEINTEDKIFSMAWQNTFLGIPVGCNFTLRSNVFKYKKESEKYNFCFSETNKGEVETDICFKHELIKTTCDGLQTYKIFGVCYN